MPVLSRATTVVAPSRSITTADLTSTPCRPALAIADSSGGMVASTTAHGEATIMKVIARSSASCRSSPASSGTAKMARVATTTPTEYRCSTRSMNIWVRALVALASSTMAAIRATTLSCGGRVTSTVSTPEPLPVPANTSSPTPLSTGSGSPVIDAWSTSEAPSTTRPSAGSRSPGPDQHPVADGRDPRPRPVARRRRRRAGPPARAPGRSGRGRRPRSAGWRRPPARRRSRR